MTELALATTLKYVALMAMVLIGVLIGSYIRGKKG
jgi:hypothetical protein